MMNLESGTAPLETLNREDIPSLLELEKQAFPIDHWSEEVFNRELADNPDCIRVMKQNGVIIGYIYTEIHDVTLANGSKERVGEIGSIAVLEDFRGKGLGEKLFRYGIAKLQKMKAPRIIIR